MDSNDFATWARRLKIMFPGFAEWLNKLDEDQRESLSAEWQDSLRTTEFVDAMESLSDIRDGEAEPFDKWERGTWVAHVRRLSAEKARVRREAERKEQPRRWDDREPQIANLGGIYREILSVIDSGGDPLESIKRLLPVDERSGPRFSCHRCRDSGFVSVWHLVTMRAVERGDELTSQNRKVMTVLCNCQLGRTRVSASGTKKTYWREGHVFDSDRHCECRNGNVNDRDSIVALREFVASLEQRQLESMPAYSPVLAQYSQRELV